MFNQFSLLTTGKLLASSSLQHSVCCFYFCKMRVKKPLPLFLYLIMAVEQQDQMDDLLDVWWIMIISVSSIQSVPKVQCVFKLYHRMWWRPFGLMLLKRIKWKSKQNGCARVNYLNIKKLCVIFTGSNSLYVIQKPSQWTTTCGVREIAL